MVVHELPFPAAWENGVQAGYGGNQEWFSQVFQHTAGYASVTGVSLTAYYAPWTVEGRGLYSGDTERLSKSEYLRIMEEVCRYMTPGPMGFPIMGQFVQKFLQFVGEHRNTFWVHTMLHRYGCEERMTFLKEMIIKGSPVAFLVLKHCAPEMRGNNWH